jgi:hypothetical protein
MSPDSPLLTLPAGLLGRECNLEVHLLTSMLPSLHAGAKLDNLVTITYNLLQFQKQDFLSINHLLHNRVLTRTVEAPVTRG